MVVFACCSLVRELGAFIFNEFLYCCSVLHALRIVCGRLFVRFDSNSLILSDFIKDLNELNILTWTISSEWHATAVLISRKCKHFLNNNTNNYSLLICLFCLRWTALQTRKIKTKKEQMSSIKRLNGTRIINKTWKKERNEDEERKNEKMTKSISYFICLHS